MKGEPHSGLWRDALRKTNSVNNCALIHKTLFDQRIHDALQWRL